MKSSRQSVTRGELIISLSKTKEEVKEKAQTEKEVGNVGGKKEKEKPGIAAQLCGEICFLHSEDTGKIVLIGQVKKFPLDLCRQYWPRSLPAYSIISRVERKTMVTQTYF